MQDRVLSAIRLAHRILPRKPLPAQVAIYFHALARKDLAALEGCLSYFARNGYRSVDAAGYAAAAGDDRCLFVSFDDNHRGWLDALPIFERLGLTATFYTNTRPFRDVANEAEIAAYRSRIAEDEGYETLTRAELASIAAAGHRIGCHSHSHYRLSGLSRDMWEAEILGCKQALEEITGQSVTDLAWPYGMRRHFSDELRDYCRSIGFRTIANAIPGCQYMAKRDPFDLYRADWHLTASLEHNLEQLRIDARLFVRLTGRSIIGRPLEA